MNYVSTLILKMLSIIGIAIIGYFIQKRGIISDKGKDVISLLLNRVALPFLIVASYARIKISEETILNTIYIMIAAVIIYFINYLYGNYLVKFFNLNLKQRCVFINGVLHANSAFLAFPLLYAVFNEIGLYYGTMYYVVDNILLFTIGVNRFRYDSSEKNKIAPVTLALFISLPMLVIANVFNVDLSKTFIYNTVNDIGSMTTPLAFIFIGMIVASSNLKKIASNKIALSALVMKLIIIPVVAIIVFIFLPFKLESMIILIIMIELLMPPYSGLLAMTYEYQKDVDLAASLVVMGNIIAIITIPVIFTIVTLLFN